MKLNGRQEEILKRLRTAERVEVDVLAKEMRVTTQTVRRDLSGLCNASLAIRTHGGAKRIMRSTVVNYEKRRTNNMAAKQAIGNQAAKLVPNSASVALNIGTTTEMVAENLSLHQDLTILSNNINVIPILRTTKLRSLVLIGGEIRLNDGAIVGKDAIETISNYKIDYAIVGASALDPDGSVLDFDEREVMVARTILANARYRILVADGSKFTVGAPHRICAASDLDYFITDKEPPPEFTDSITRSGTKVIIAEKNVQISH